VLRIIGATGSVTRPSADRARGTVVTLELFTGVAAVVGGLLLVIDPDGSMLQAKESSLRGSPFADWRIPGLLLTTLVGGGLLLAGACHLVKWRHATLLSIFAGLGLVMFEVVEMAWLGLQPLEFVFATVGITIVVVSSRST
jgi:hypothetical protein